MSQVRIITDSTNCLPSELIKRHNITVVPVGLVIDGKPYRDQVDITLQEICQQIYTLEKQPSTSAVSPGEFISAYTELAGVTDKVVCILVSKVLSATQESAYQAKRFIRQQLPDLNIEIVDSKTSAGALGFIVLEAARAAEQGKSMEEVVEIAKDMSSRVIYLSVLDTLKYLIKIGRAPKGITSFGEILDIKPIIGFVDDTGFNEIIARVRGKHKALTKMVDMVADYVDVSQPLHVMVHYSDGTGEAEELKKMVTSKYKCAEFHVTPYTPVIVSATGPNTGLSLYS